MSYQKTELYFLFALLAGVSVLVFFIFQPFLYTLILAVIFATVFFPVHKNILDSLRGREGLSALISTALVVVVIVVPIIVLSTQIFKEASQLYSSLVSNGSVSSISQELEGSLRNAGIPFLPEGSLDVSQYVKQGLSLLIHNLGAVFSNIVKIMAGIFVLFIALYYLFKDGDKLKRAVVSLSPLQDIYDETVIQKLELAINSVVRGSISVGMVQGFLTAVGLAIFGVPNPVLWGSVAAIAALIPGVGTSLVIVPAVLFLFFTGATVPAFGLLAWGVIAVGLVDNILGPKLVGKGVQLHSFLVLLSILGGIGVFGALGFLFGPLALSLLFALLGIYATLRGEKNS